MQHMNSLLFDLKNKFSVTLFQLNINKDQYEINIYVIDEKHIFINYSPIKLINIVKRQV